MEKLIEGLIDYLASKSTRFLLVLGGLFLLVAVCVGFFAYSVHAGIIGSSMNTQLSFLIKAAIGLFFFVFGIISILMSIFKSVGQQQKQEMDDQAEHFECYDSLERDADSIKIETKVSYKDPFLEFLEKRKSNRS